MGTKTSELSDTDRADLALALVLWRYVGHRLVNGHISPTDESLARQQRALRLAKRLGIRDEYLAAMFRVPVVNVKVGSGLRVC